MKTSIGAKTILFPTPVFLVGSYDADNQPNIMTVAWGGICCSSPPCVTVSLRKATYSYGNIVTTKAYTISIPSSDIIAKADAAGIISGKNADKFAALGLTPVKSEIVNAPYVAECPFVIECEVIHVLELGLHTQFVGKVLDIKVDEEFLSEGKVDMKGIKPCCYDPASSGYFSIGEFLGSAFKIGKSMTKE